jgi:hypothetical protein
MITKNLVFFGLVLGTYLAIETGYFSNDRTSRGQWTALQAAAQSAGRDVVYEAKFDKDTLSRQDQPDGRWTPYNGARPETLSVEGDALVVQYSLAWLGVAFKHLTFEPSALYRVRFEARVEDEPAALLMRNRQLDLLRQTLPVTGSTFKEFTADYAAPGGRLDQVHLIVMPNGRQKVSGRISIRNFRIERMGR